MSDVCLKNHKKSRKKSSAISKKKENEKKEKKEEKEEKEEKKEEDKKSEQIINSNSEKNASFNSNEINSNEDIIYLMKKKKNLIHEDKQIQNGTVISINKENKENINQKENEIKINNEKEQKIREYQEKIKTLENNLKLMNEKDKVIQKITKINLKLKNSLELISKQLDEKIDNANLIRNNRSKNRVKTISDLNNENQNKKEFKFITDVDKKTISENIIKEKELNNAVNMIKILRTDNQRLQNKIEEIEKNQELEKQSQDKKQILLEKELQEHKVCKQKLENYQEKIRKLTEKNKSLMEKLIYGKTKRASKNFVTNNISSEDEGSFGGKFHRIKERLIKETIGSNTNKSVKKSNLFNLKKLGETRSQNSSLPRLNFTNNPLLNSTKNNISNNNIINIKNIFNDEETFQLNKVFSKDEKVFQIIIKKFEILQKSKESIDNKYKLEQKQFIKRIQSMQQQIDYLNDKIREKELKLNILQAQLNEAKLEKKQLLKRVKILSERCELNEFNINHIEDNFNNNEKKNNSKKNKKIKSSEKKYQDELSIDNSDFKGQKINNSIELGNEGESLSGQNFTEET